METNNERLTPFKPTHPGEILKEELAERGITQKEFAQLIGMHASHLNAFIKGKRNMNEDLAIKLEKHLGIPYNVWMSLHAGYIYECKTAHKTSPDCMTMESLSKVISAIAKKLLNKGMQTTDIADVTGLTPEEIQAL